MSPSPDPTPWEAARLAVQQTYDAAHPAAERNRLGQFATPGALARALVRVGLDALPAGQPVRFLDPALGTGAFFSALLAERGSRPVARALGVELDPAVVALAQALWAGSGLELRPGDFTQLTPGPQDRANLLIANPPYVRHHHLGRAVKEDLARRLAQHTGLRLSGLAGLYCYFLLLSRAWMAPEGIAVWLIPSEFMDVNYGDGVKRFLLSQVTLLRVHRADPRDVQFGDALVSSAVVVLQNRPPGAQHRVQFTYGGSVERPAVERAVDLATLAAQPRWTRFPKEVEAPRVPEGRPLGELFQIKRGIATGGNKFFVLEDAQVAALGLPREHLTPILPPPRRLAVDRVLAGPDGAPDLPGRSWLLSCSRPEAEVRGAHPALWRYLMSGVPAVSSGYLCSRRTPWYTQETRAPAPLLCTYMGRDSRGRPFRFILNESNAIAANVYLLLYPRAPLQAAMHTDPGLLERIWRFLNALPVEALVREGRVYGGGLFKLEPGELAAVHLPATVWQDGAGSPRPSAWPPQQLALDLGAADSAA